MGVVSGALEGVFVDPNHSKPKYGCGGSTCESLEGLRMIHTNDEGGITLVGADNDGVVWVLLGGMKDEHSGAMNVDFSIKAPQVGILDGVWTGNSIDWVDGNAWQKVDAVPRLEYDEDADIQFDGMYADPDIWDGSPSLAGLRFVSHRTGKIDGISITALGTNDGTNFFSLVGAFRIGNSFKMDFTPIGGKKAWDGIQIKGALLWPDGTKWVKVRGVDAKGSPKQGGDEL